LVAFTAASYATIKIIKTKFNEYQQELDAYVGPSVYPQETSTTEESTPYEPSQQTGGDYTSGRYEGTSQTVRIKNKIIEEANRQGVDPALALGLAEQESHFNPKAKSQTGARGIFQMTSVACKQVGIPFDDKLYDADYNIKYGIKYLKWCLDHTKTVEEALFAWNSGIGNLQKAKKAGDDLGTWNSAQRTSKKGGFTTQTMPRIEKYKKELQQLQPQAPVQTKNLEDISKRHKIKNNGVQYDENSNITSATNLSSGTNEYYNAKGGYGMGTYMGKAITSGIGKRSVKGGSGFHRGLDLAYSLDTPVYSFCSGFVWYKDVMSGFGYCVIIQDKNGYRHVYGHLNRFANIQKGKHYPKGTLIGYSGRSGTENGKLVLYKFAPHLHYGIWKPGGTRDKYDYIDPRTYTYAPEPREQLAQNKDIPSKQIPKQTINTKPNQNIANPKNVANKNQQNTNKQKIAQINPPDTTVKTSNTKTPSKTNKIDVSQPNLKIALTKNY